ncbi:MAG: NAD(P)/FAD-dependent oxidoreductase [Cyclobacteriaceae bacterium]
MEKVKPSSNVQSRRTFLQQSASLMAAFTIPNVFQSKKKKKMTTEKFDVIIIGGSYSGLAAGMGLGRALRKVLIIDSGRPANRYTPHSHNFLTHDGRTPAEIAAIAKEQVDAYKTVKRITGLVVHATRYENDFHVSLANGTEYSAIKLIFATGIIDQWPDIRGFSECWGKSVLHCPYCHGYEVRDAQTGILGNGDYAFEFAGLISNWTRQLTVYTNGPSTLSSEQNARLKKHNISVIEDRIDFLRHSNGYLDGISFMNGNSVNVNALYARPPFKQSSEVPESLGCELTEDGYLKIDAMHHTTVPGVYACGDNVTRMRTVANAISMGTSAAIALNKDFVLESF